MTSPQGASGRSSCPAQPDRVTADVPSEGYEAPPGYYMLFLISNLGVPSVAEYVQVVSW